MTRRHRQHARARALPGPFLALAIGASALAGPPADFDARVESLRKEVGVPGMAIAIVENGKVTLAKGYGVKRLGSQDLVDADTIFPTGSTGKAFTVADLAILARRLLQRRLLHRRDDHS